MYKIMTVLARKGHNTFINKKEEVHFRKSKVVEVLLLKRVNLSYVEN